MPAVTLLAADLGASSGRVMRAQVGPDELSLDEVHRFRNGPVALPDGLHWDILGLYLDVLTGLRRAVTDAGANGGAIASIGVDSWAVDYGLVGADGALRGNPFHYRDSRASGAIERVHARLDRRRLYELNGLQHLPFNTLFQLASEPGRLVDRVLLIPDLIGFWLTGEQVAERTNASTTGLLDARTGQWSPEILAAVGVAEDLLPVLVDPGHPIASLRPGVLLDTGLPASVQLTAVGSHDTASAVAGVPATEPDFAYISCGTWGLVGVELAEPVLTEASRAANFTNERGVEGTVRYLRNVMGLWLLQESLRHWRIAGDADRLAALLAAAEALPPGGPIFDPDLPAFLPPGDMPARIVSACAEAGGLVPADQVQLVRCILDSLAVAFARTVHEAAALSGRAVQVVHLVGGGSQNSLLCQLVADACGLPVLAGPVEATAIGNILVQARAVGALTGDRWQARELIARTHPVQRFLPRS